MIPQKLIDDFVNKMRTAGGPNVESIILFGAAASGEFHEGLSNLTMFCVLRDCSF
jgi:predicted nucleotidyltransferase